jgi:hypothetical protein
LVPGNAHDVVPVHVDGLRPAEAELVGRPKLSKAPAVIAAPEPAEAVGATTLGDFEGVRDLGNYIAPERVSYFIEFVFNGGPNPRGNRHAVDIT